MTLHQNGRKQWTKLELYMSGVRMYGSQVFKKWRSIHHVLRAAGENVLTDWDKHPPPLPPSTPGTPSSNTSRFISRFGAALRPNKTRPTWRKSRCTASRTLCMPVSTRRRVRCTPTFSSCSTACTHRKRQEGEGRGRGTHVKQAVL